MKPWNIRCIFHSICIRRVTSVVSRLGEFVYMNNISRSLTHDRPDLIAPQAELQQTKQPANTNWNLDWVLANVLCQPNLFISIKINPDVSMLPVIGGQVRWRYQNIRYCLPRKISPSMGDVWLDNFPVNICDRWVKQWLLHQVSDCAV